MFESFSQSRALRVEKGTASEQSIILSIRRSRRRRRSAGTTGKLLEQLNATEIGKHAYNCVNSQHFATGLPGLAEERLQRLICIVHSPPSRSVQNPSRTGLLTDVIWIFMLFVAHSYSNRFMDFNPIGNLGSSVIYKRYIHI